MRRTIYRQAWLHPLAVGHHTAAVILSSNKPRAEIADEAVDFGGRRAIRSPRCLFGPVAGFVADAFMTADDCLDALELTILLPCLNEAETIETCVDKAMSYLAGSDV